MLKNNISWIFVFLNDGYYVKLCKSRQTPLDVGTKEKDDSQTPLKKVGFSWKSLKFVDSRSKLCIQVIILKRQPTPPCLFKGSLFVKDKNCPHGLVNQDNFSEMKIGRLQRFYLKCDPSKREGELDSWRDFFWPTVLFCFCRRGFVLFWPTAAAIRKFSREDPLFLSGDSREVILHLIERGEYFFNVFFPFWISFSLWVVGKEYPWAFLEDLWHTVTKPPDGFYQYLTHSTFQLLPIHPRTFQFNINMNSLSTHNYIVEVLYALITQHYAIQYLNTKFWSFAIGSVIIVNFKNRRREKCWMSNVWNACVWVVGQKRKKWIACWASGGKWEISFVRQKLVNEQLATQDTRPLTMRCTQWQWCTPRSTHTMMHKMMHTMIHTHNDAQNNAHSDNDIHNDTHWRMERLYP